MAQEKLWDILEVLNSRRPLNTTACAAFRPMRR